MVYNHLEFSLKFFLNRDVCAVSPVAVLNTVLNNQSKGTNPIFYKCPTGASSYGLIVSIVLNWFIFLNILTIDQEIIIFIVIIQNIYKI